ncbi:MAG: hypothetical protein AMXMBFR77_06360 [Phycisphaerales bacterium]|nr:radical SAM protein [Synechococcales cyanobacterium CNB]
MFRANKPSRLAARGLALACLVASIPLALGGCSKPPPPPPPPPPPAPPPPPPPEPVDARAVVQALNASAAVQFVESQAPVDRSLAEAVVRLADAFARGDASAARRLLDKPAQSVLDTLVASDEWAEATSRIEAVRIVWIDDYARFSESPTAASVAFAVQEPGASYILRWDGTRVFDSWVFGGAPATPEVRVRATAWDGLAQSDYESAGGMALADGGNPFGLPEEVLAQLRAMGLDPANLDLDAIEKMLEEMGDQLPPEVVRQIRDLLRKLRDAGITPGTAPGGTQQDSERDPRRKNTPGGPITIPGG